MYKKTVFSTLLLLAGLAAMGQRQEVQVSEE
jgi:hypothetical protein